MNINEITLSDGRSLLYFDRFAVDREAVDLRDLEPATGRSVMRQDLLTGEWVLIASARQSRIFMPANDSCPLCPTTPENQSEIPSNDFDLVIFENRFAALSHSQLATIQGEIDGYGRCEVVCFSPDHVTPLAFLGLDKIYLYIAALSQRTLVLSQDPKVNYIFAFENRGERVGVTLPHPHGQIYAYPFVPPRVLTMVNTEFAQRCDIGKAIVKANEIDPQRTLIDSEHWIAFVPYAARWPYEVHIFPKRAIGMLPDLEPAEMKDLALVYGSVLSAFENLFESETSYISSWIQAPVNCSMKLNRMHIEIVTPQRSEERYKFLAGSESGVGTFINDITPEQAASTLRPLVHLAHQELRRLHG